jgi:hypothetical protein
MYSVVVLMALSTSVDTPDLGRRGGCRGCGGCYGGCWSSCYGCSGCYGGYSCHGCYGSYHSCHGCYSTLHHSHYHHSHHHHCHGCCGGVIIHPAAPPMKGGKEGGALIPGGTPYIAASAEPTTGSAARIEVSLPAAGQLTIDDYTVPTTSDRHVYITSPLASGEKRTVILKSQNATKEVTVIAGQTLQVTLTPQGVGTASR